MSDLAICTIISKNYLPFARTLAQSFRKYNEGRVFVLLVDRVDGYFKPEDEPFDLIDIETLRDNIPDFDKFCFQYTILELNTGVKPFLLEYLFKNHDIKKLIYFDPDILITNRLNELSSLLEKYSIILTPHLTAPYNDSCKPGEIEILQSGAYNLGFIALSNSPTVTNMIHWWQKRLYNHCVVAIEKGLFVDQRWMDLVPGIFDNVFILRHPGYNAAYWNYHCRKVVMKDGGGIYVNDLPAYFLHFSGFNPEDIGPVSKHQNRFTIDRIEYIRPVFELYRDQVLANGWKEIKKWPYVFSHFDNEAKIPDFVRRLYLEIGERAVKFGNPFCTANKNSFFNWLKETVRVGDGYITRLMHELYKVRPDIQQAFPDIAGRDRKQFLLWITTSGKKDYDLDDRFFENININDEIGRRLTVNLNIKRLINKTKSSIGRVSKQLFGYHHPAVNYLRKLNNIINKQLMTASDYSAVSKSISKININKEVGVNIAGYINSESGVGEAVRGNIRSFEVAGIPYILNNIESSSRQADQTYTQFNQGNPHNINFIHINADQVPVFFQQKGENYFKDKYNIGYWVWELSAFPDEWIPHFQLFDEIWTASQFCADSISKVSPIPVVRIPHSVHIEKIENLHRTHFALEEESYTFLFMFDLLSYFERKNPLALIEAFKMAFKPEEDVQLVLKCSNSKWSPLALETIEKEIKGLRVKLIDNPLTRGEVYSLINISDCYVSLHRSEGFGLPLAEAMYMGKPVIATAYSGNTDFMNINNSFNVRYKLVEIERDVGPYKAGSVWAEPDVNHAAELMRYVYENREVAKRVGRIASEDIKAQLSPAAVGKIINERMRIITTMEEKRCPKLVR